jgi:hypothetical protein
LGAGLVLFCVIATILYLHDVNNTITDDDRFYIRKILERTHNNPETLKNTDKFDEQIQTILSIQNSAFDATPNAGQMPLDRPREPKNLAASDTAYCNDRARYLDKAFRLYGFETRYASLYAKISGKVFLQTFLTLGTKGAFSHALLEVKTQKGWIVVDTRNRWISLDRNNQPHSLIELQNAARSGFWPAWSSLSKEKPYELLNDEFYIIYGLYSRHGRFYPPYTPYIPDIDFQEFVKNFVR